MLNKRWFTLVEILVWISISVILMFWVSIFVVDSIKNITLQKKILNNEREFDKFYTEVFEDINSKSTNFEKIFSSWFLISWTDIFWKWNFSYIWVKTFTWYCEYDLAKETKHLQIINFSPFENSSFDIFNNNYFSWTSINVSWDIYKTDTKNHNVYKNNELIIWKWVFWDRIGNSWISTYLRNPTWLAYYDWKLFISDTWNNRILYFLNWKIYKFLDINDWILSPTWILFDNWVLYISNSWKWEILSYEVWQISAPTNVNLKFNVENDIFWVNEINIVFRNKSWNIVDISAPTSTWSFTFSWITKSVWDSVSAWNQLKYSFSSSKNILQWNYSIDISSISWDFASNWNYYIELNISWEKYYFPFFTRWTWNIFTNKNNNILKKVYSWLWYPTWIEVDSWNLVVYDFLQRKKIKITKSWSYVWAENLHDFAFWNILKSYSKISDFIISDFKSNYSSWLLNLKVDYYKNFDCYDENQNILKSFLLKKNF